MKKLLFFITMLAMLASWSVKAQTADPKGDVHEPGALSSDQITTYNGEQYEVFYFSKRSSSVLYFKTKNYDSGTEFAANSSSWIFGGASTGSASSSQPDWAAQFHEGRKSATGNMNLISNLRSNTQSGRQIVMLVKGYSEVAIQHTAVATLVIDTQVYDEAAATYGTAVSTTSSASGILSVALESDKQYKITFRGATTSNYTSGIGAFSLKLPSGPAVCSNATAQTVTATATTANGVPTTAIGLASSQSGATYTLYKDGDATTTTAAGTGSAISFGNFDAAGTYTVKATGNGTTICEDEVSMANSVVVTTLTLNIAAESVGRGTVSGAGSYPQGATATAKATANRGYVFSNWGAGIYSATQTITMDQNYTYTASFVAASECAVSATAGTGIASATVTSFADSKYYVGDEITFTATASTGYTFDGWYKDDALISSDSELKITISSEDTHLNLEARATKDPDPLGTPTANAASNITTTTAGLSWGAAAEATSYKVEVCTTTGAGAAINESFADVTSSTNGKDYLTAKGWTVSPSSTDENQFPILPTAIDGAILIGSNGRFYSPAINIKDMGDAVIEFEIKENEAIGATDGTNLFVITCLGGVPTATNNGFVIKSRSTKLVRQSGTVVNKVEPVITMEKTLDSGDWVSVKIQLNKAYVNTDYSGSDYVQIRRDAKSTGSLFLRNFKVYDAAATTTTTCFNSVDNASQFAFAENKLSATVSGLTAETAYTYTVTAIRGEESNKSNEVSFTTSADAPSTYSLTINVSPEGAGSVTGAGTYDADAEATVTATANHGYVFDSWSGGSVVDGKITMTENTTLTANFTAYGETDRLTVSASGVAEGSGVATATVSTFTDGFYYLGDVVTFTATLADGYEFLGWFVADSETPVSADLVYEAPALTGDLALEARARLIPTFEAPTAAEATDITSSSAILSWSGVGADSYQVFVCESSTLLTLDNFDNLVTGSLDGIYNEDGSITLAKDHPSTIIASTPLMNLAGATVNVETTHLGESGTYLKLNNNGGNKTGAIINWASDQGTRKSYTYTILDSESTGSDYLAIRADSKAGVTVHSLTVTAPDTFVPTCINSTDNASQFQFGEDGLSATVSGLDSKKAYSYYVVATKAGFADQTSNKVEFTTTEAVATEYTVTLVAGEGTVEGGSELKGSSVNLPVATANCATEGWGFAGWSTTNLETETGTAPTLIPVGEYTPTEDITLYAVYEKTTVTYDAASTNYELVTAADIEAGLNGDYLIAATDEEGQVYVLNGSLSGTSLEGANNATTVTVNPGAGVNEEASISDANAYRVNIQPVTTDAYVIRAASGDYFINNSNSSGEATASNDFDLASNSLYTIVLGAISSNYTSGNPISLVFNSETQQFLFGAGNGAAELSLYQRVGATVSSVYHTSPTCTVTDCTAATSIGSFATATVTKTMDDAAATFTNEFTADASNPNTNSIYYEIDSDIATINRTTGEVTVLSAGTTTVRAYQLTDGTYCYAETSYKLTVNASSIKVTFDPGTGTGRGGQTEPWTLQVDGGGYVPVYPADACDPNVWHFSGWSTTSIANETTTFPAGLIGLGRLKPTEDMTLYAVYTESSPGNLDAIVKVWDFASEWVLDETYADDNLKVAITETGDNRFSYNASRDYEELILSTGTIIPDTEDLLFNFATTSSTSTQRIRLGFDNGLLYLNESDKNTKHNIKMAIPVTAGQSVTIEGIHSSSTPNNTRRFDVLTSGNAETEVWSSGTEGWLNLTKSANLTDDNGGTNKKQQVLWHYDIPADATLYEKDGQTYMVVSPYYGGINIMSITVKTADAGDSYYSTNRECDTEYTVILNPGNGSLAGSTAGAEHALMGTSFDLPTAIPCDTEAWEFAGWSLESIANTTQAPSGLISIGEYVPTKETTTLYAVYKYAGATEETAKDWNFAKRWTIGASDADENLVLNGEEFEYAPELVNDFLAFANEAAIPDTKGLTFTAPEFGITLAYQAGPLGLSTGGIEIAIPYEAGQSVTISASAGNGVAVNRGFSATGGTLNTTSSSSNINADGILTKSGETGTWVYDTAGEAGTLRLTTVIGGMDIWKISVSTITEVEYATIHECPYIWSYKEGADKTNDWNTASNWDNDQVPGEGDNVLIKGDAPIYPVLGANTAAIKNIRFEQGAEIGNINFLQYNRAYVQFDFSKSALSRNRWVMIAMPLKEVYTGDLSFGGYPITYHRAFDVTENPYTNTDEGTWTNSLNNVDIKLEPGRGFGFWIDDNSSTVGEAWADENGLGLAATNGIIELPFFLNAKTNEAHINHNFIPSDDTNKLGDSRINFYRRTAQGLVQQPTVYETVTRSEDAYQLITADFNYTVDFSPLNNLAILGNPYMTALNFDKLAGDNDTKIKGSYKIWDGTSMKTYSSDVTTTVASFIAPLSSIIIEKAEDASVQESIAFDISNISATKERLNYLKSSSVDANRLVITAENSSGSIETYIAHREGGSSIVGNKDSRKLLMDDRNKKLPEIYSLKADKSGDAIGLDINVLSSDYAQVPLGIISSQAGSSTLTFEGMDNYDAEIRFTDAVTGENVILTGMSSYEYQFDNTVKTDSRGNLLAVEDRFQVSFAPSVITGMDDDEVLESVQIYAKNNQIYVNSSVNNPIVEIAIYNMQGALIYNNDQINAASYIVSDLNSATQAYVVKAITEKGVKTKTVVNK